MSHILSPKAKWRKVAPCFFEKCFKRINLHYSTYSTGCVRSKWTKKWYWCVEHHFIELQMNSNIIFWTSNGLNHVYLLVYNWTRTPLERLNIELRTSFDPSLVDKAKMPLILEYIFSVSPVCLPREAQTHFGFTNSRVKDA